ncbi:MAG TPA: bifunctional 4-hydroxy-2-oxoglutarate aldolase/2-dehydro-3-deoxy-phosphogluconate aldolase [Baekduia sp.]|uniref:bifunctional 4-hydroxy-2-oxoglutarate aldolase/2-dehydro-3-deoxy-phosphogluconate aldolase n=1 Tax=Baekduia sp. TaxID=2600305 RepID=UPI002D78E498|nr:bifunctional 4-hydroxy-2-oxoglutarate aldolase/2-dehydro-3-deoxy-phosphogluconate aldolase [Baekduia sp.]HET6508008.1 bifunctional 4-hydroxy-2-oxoglutarate aldolase/2-dehydro-3-deoxy-phosphogluconate aldolase [Baekduia sp.]
MSAAPLTIDAVMALAPVIPVVVLDDPDAAVPLARALVAGGLPAIEVTLRTPAALEAIARIAADVPDAVVGAGTVTTAAQAADAAAAGARFLVAPGQTPRLLDALEDRGLPFLAGTATASDLVALRERGIATAKFFPAAANGGPAALRALGAPFPELRFCPTGGIDPNNVADYLALGNVACVGGSWMAAPAAIAAGDWPGIEAAARAARAASA